MHIPKSELHIPAPAGLALPAEFLLGVRPEDVKPEPEGEFAGRVSLIEPLGVETIVHIRSGELTLLSLVPGMTQIAFDDQIRFNIIQERLHWFDLQGERIGQRVIIQRRSTVNCSALSCSIRGGYCYEIWCQFLGMDVSLDDHRA